MQVGKITTDNASNNATMIDQLVKIVWNINPLFDHKCHMPCLVHVLKLEIQDDLKVLKAIVEEDSSTPCISSSKSLGDVITHVRKIVNTIRSFLSCMEKYERFCCGLGISSTRMPNLDISMWWNSTYDMLSEAYDKRIVLKKMVMLF